MTSEHLVFEEDGEVGILTLNRPDRLNALDASMLTALGDLFERLAEPGERCRVILMQGAGRAFCAGADLGSQLFAEDGPGKVQRRWAAQQHASRIIRAMRRCPQPIIALLHGPVCGGGFSIALAADVRLAAPDTRMNAAYLRVGLGGADMGAGYLLTRLVGQSVASALLLTGDFLGAERAREVGLVAEIHPREELLDAGLAIAQRMLLASPLGLRMTKDALNLLVDCGGLDAGLAIEDRQQVVLLETADHHEAVAAFMEKRKPVYRDQ